MSEKERLNEVILEEENNGSGTKKVFLIVAIAIIILAVLLMVFWKSTRVAPKETFLQTDSGMQKIGNTKDEKKDDAFESLNMDSPKQEDKLDKVVDNIKKQESENSMPIQTDQAQMEMKTTEEKQESQKELKAVEPIPMSAQKESQAVAKKETPHKKPKVAPKDKEAHKDKAKHAAKKEPKVKKEAHKEVSKKANSKTNHTKGHYLQVGVFVHTPNKAFLQEFNQFPHKIEDRGATKRYLIGPYKSKQEALMHADEVSKKMTKPVVIEVR
ncbi:SPOR domain-containing protein [Helicobacter pylori]|uniref:SPOR domain-containing protein n=1 Tax=Helicobacter pylori TaxID=210 RepID=UPI0013B07F1A|nr:SPOR domain-containing protein [Helicobacter pylori]QIC80647.1 SPOR domain-containing protein [Helicobacter pylori]